MTELQHSMRDAMEIAEAKSKPGWKAFRWQAAGRDNVISGRVPGGVYQRGPKRGLPRFDHPASGPVGIVCVSEAELNAAAQDYEAGGKCWNCKGKREVMAGWNIEEGARFKPCKRCNGTGMKITVDASPR